MATLTIDGIEWTTIGREGWASVQLKSQPFAAAYIEALVDTSTRSAASLDATGATVRLATHSYTIEGREMVRTVNLDTNGYQAFVRFEGGDVHPI